MRVSRAGLWVTRARGGRQLYRWWTLLPLAAFPALVVACLLVAANRQTWAFAYLWSHGAPARREALSELGELNRAALSSLVRGAQVRERSALPTLRLKVSRRALELMQESIHRGDPALGHAPGGNKPYVDGRITDESGVTQRCKVSYRGLTPVHHWPVKPSLRVRIKKDEVRLGRRYLELQRPEDALLLGNALPEELARGLGVLSNLSDPVRVFLNRRFLGVYLRTTRPGEPLAARQGRLPGTFLKGDALGTRWSGQLFARVEAWKITGEDPAQGRAALGALLQALRGRGSRFGAEDLRGLLALVDAEAYAGWAAVMALVGGVSVDHDHNHVLFLDTTRGLLEPVVWDVNAFRVAPDSAVDVIRHPITDRLSRDPRWVHRRNLRLAALLAGPGSSAALTQRIEAWVARLGPDLRADPYTSELRPSLTGFSRVGLVPVGALPERLARLKAWVAARERYLRAFLAAAVVFVEPGEDRTVARVAGTVAVRARHPQHGERLLYPGLSEQLVRRRGESFTFALPAELRYALPGRGWSFRNAISGAPVAPRASPLPSRPARTIPPAELPVPASGPRTLGPGVVDLERDLVIGAGETLTVQPGTRLRLAPGVGIVARGRVIAEGRPDAWIELAPRDPGQPWGSLALLGPGASGSRFAHVRLRGGSATRRGSLHLKGMLSGYHCGQVLLRRCEVGANARGDDAVNLAHAQVDVRDCRFEGALADGLDLDRCRGVVRGSRFVACGNDGLDLMSSRVRVSDTTFERCGDKGISVGEGSRLLVERARFDRCKIGLQAKDGSSALVRESAFTRCGTALDAYPKKWVYGNQGGRILLAHTTVRGSETADATLRGRSGLWLWETTLADAPAMATRVAALPEAWARLEASLRGVGPAGP